MAEWSSNELETIDATDELEISSMREGDALSGSRTIWVVHAGDDLYIRSVYGRDGEWHRGTQSRHEGHIRCGGVEKDVSFVDVDADDEVQDRIDDAYRAKYPGYPKKYVDDCLTPQARAATLRLVPRSA